MMFWTKYDLKSCFISMVIYHGTKVKKLLKTTPSGCLWCFVELFLNVEALDPSPKSAIVRHVLSI